MKKHAFLVLLLITFSFISAQEVIENPEKPLNKNAGRVLKLEEELRITDESGEFYFSYPNTIKVAYDDSIFINDSQQLLRFDKNGHFIRNYFVKGQGPGELTSVNNYVLTEDAIIIYDGRARRITWLNYDGELIKDFKIDLEVRLQDFLLFSNNTYYFSSRDHIITNEKPLVVDQPHRLFALTHNGKEISELIEFPVKMYLLSSQVRAVWRPISRFFTIDFKEEYLIVSHTQDYLIKIFDFGTQSVIRRFNREYKRVE
ncbi:MAG: 6-bladed beta-propeller, partial [Candidatus Aminicenantes bacterium]|nr:6-bladed beta-propeller [Candidatus Aminicenantes bacterium]